MIALLIVIILNMV